MNGVRDNIDDGLNYPVSTYEDSISKNNGVHVGYASFSEGVTKDAGISKRSYKKLKKM